MSAQARSAVDTGRTPSTRPLGWWAPLLLDATVTVLDILAGPGLQYTGVFTAVPLLASALAGPWVTLLQGLAAAGVSVGLGVVELGRYHIAADQLAIQYRSQVVRVTIVLIMTVLAVAVARHRTVVARRAQEIAAVADAAQQAILAPTPDHVGGLGCASVYVSAVSQARIGGDLVEVLDTPFGVRALVGDVQGKGLEAVRLAGRVLGCFREAAYEVATLPELARALDRTVGRVAAPEVFVTAALVQLDASTGELNVVSCGHPAPYVVSPSFAEAVPLDVSASAPLGMLAMGLSPRASRVRLRPGSRLVLVTDGLLEARRPRRFSRQPTGPFIEAESLLGQSLAPRHDLREGLDDVVRQARRWTRGRMHDDLAILVLSLPGSAPPVPEARYQHNDVA